MRRPQQDPLPRQRRVIRPSRQEWEVPPSLDQTRDAEAPLAALIRQAAQHLVIGLDHTRAAALADAVLDGLPGIRHHPQASAALLILGIVRNRLGDGQAIRAREPRILAGLGDPRPWDRQGIEVGGRRALWLLELIERASLDEREDGRRLDMSLRTRVRHCLEHQGAVDGPPTCDPQVEPRRDMLVQTAILRLRRDWRPDLWP